MSDLFDTRTKKERLLDFMKSQVYCPTSQVIKWGTLNFFNEASRTAHRLANEGKIRRLSEEEAIFRGFKGKEKIWVVV